MMTGPPDAFCVLVSGLPASGKSTLARQVAPLLGARLFDKDDFLEALFERETNLGDAEWRRRLSTQSNRDFQRAASAESQAVLVSHWRPPGDPGPSGTPTDWVVKHFACVVELCCHCPAPLAAQRFIERRRHPGHNDATRTLGELERWFEGYAATLPFGVGPVLEVDTTIALDASDVARRIEALITARR